MYVYIYTSSSIAALRSSLLKPDTSVITVNSRFLYLIGATLTAAWIYTYIYIYIYAYKCIYRYISSRSKIHTHIYVYMYTYYHEAKPIRDGNGSKIRCGYIHIYKYIYICIYMCTWLVVYVYIYIYTYLIFTLRDIHLLLLIIVTLSFTLRLS
jgi:hypothetical protein